MVPAPKPPHPNATKRTQKRRDGTGHLDRGYAKSLMRESGASSRKQTDRAFLNGARSTDTLAEELGEEFVQTATSGEYEGEEAMNQTVPEDVGGPFVTSGNVDEDEDADE